MRLRSACCFPLARLWRLLDFDSTSGALSPGLSYAIDSRRIQSELGWRPAVDVDTGIARTVRWYLDNQPWLDQVASGDYQTFYQTLYGNRGRA